MQHITLGTAIDAAQKIAQETNHPQLVYMTNTKKTCFGDDTLHPIYGIMPIASGQWLPSGAIAVCSPIHFK